MKGGLGNIMKQAQAMQENLHRAQEELAKIEVTGTAGGGMVSVTMTCRHDVKKIQVDASLMDDDKEVLEDLGLGLGLILERRGRIVQALADVEPAAECLGEVVLHVATPIVPQAADPDAPVEQTEAVVPREFKARHRVSQEHGGVSRPVAIQRKRGLPPGGSVPRSVAAPSSTSASSPTWKRSGITFRATP